ncbi:MAG: glycosyltransferase [Scytonema sp. PMC 1069.18]|nr:glycosyltransferase [Scytonema sp. PMC 1069.18]MEC4882330.1 glycosyltransferase [Scytonema sp. PMC 1070.18]
MSKFPPKISVLMSVYNGSRYLQKSIETILNQTFANFEFIIIDDCSTDSSWEIINDYANKDQRIKLFKNEENLGLTKSLKKGFKLAQGEYIARQDADDISLQKRFEKQVSLLDTHPKVILVSCNIEVINAEGKKVAEHQQACDSQWIPWYLMFYNHVAGHSQVMFRRKPVEDIGGYSETRPYSQDYELWCRLIKVGDIFILPEVLQKQRLHNKSISAEKSTQQRTLSLNQSKHNIEHLIDKELSLEEVANLRWFWVGHQWWAHFPNPQTVDTIHFSLKEIYLAFLQQNTQKSTSQREMSLQLRLLIGQQFIRWIQNVSVLHLLSRLKISLYAFSWYAPGVLSCWLKDIYRIPLRKLFGLVQHSSIRTPSLSVIRQESNSTL